jgi:putative transcription factor
MSACDMCGMDVELVDAIVEGTMLQVCRRCSSYGDVITVERVQPDTKKPRKIVVEEETSHVVDDCSQRVKSAREKKKLKQQELAQQIGERESVIHKIESGHLQPSHDLARKLERYLGVNLLVTYKELPKKTVDLREGELTIGDLLKYKGKRSS